MKMVAIKNPEDVEFVFVAEHYDHHISGLCRHEGELCQFRAVYDTYSRAARSAPRLFYEIFSMSMREKARWLFRKWLFETCVGKHWTYPHRLRRAEYVHRRPLWLHDLLFRLYYRLMP